MAKSTQKFRCYQARKPLLVFFPLKRHLHLTTIRDELEGILHSEARPEQCRAGWGVASVSGVIQVRETSGAKVAGIFALWNWPVVGPTPKCPGRSNMRLPVLTSIVFARIEACYVLMLTLFSFFF